MFTAIRACLALVLILTALPANAGEVSVAVAANFLATAKTLAADFDHHHPGDRVAISAGSTGKLYAQIHNGAPYDLFLSADRQRPQLLEQEDLTVPGSRFTYAVGRLVLWSPDPRQVRDMPAALQHPTFQHLAIANPITAPYGAAARHVLQQLGVWVSLHDQLVRGENIGQTFEFVASGNAQLGFVALSQALRHHPAGAYWPVPATLYPPIEQQAVLLRHGADNPAARAFLAYLRSPAARKVIATQGYGTP